MLQARMATRVAKPNGQFWLRPEAVAGFMLDKKVSDLPGRPELILHCYYLVRGVDGSCAEHLTVESYSVVICQQSFLLLLLFRTHSFIPGLKPFFLQILPTAAFLFLLQY